MKRLFIVFLLLVSTASAQPRVYLQDDILYSKQAIFNALAATYPDEFQGLPLSDLVSYGIDPDDPGSFSKYVFATQDLGSGKYQTKIIRFEQGAIMQLLLALDPDLFAGKTIDDLVSYADDPSDPTKVRFVFKEVKQ